MVVVLFMVVLLATAAQAGVTRYGLDADFDVNVDIGNPEPHHQPVDEVFQENDVPLPRMFSEDEAEVLHSYTNPGFKGPIPDMGINVPGTMDRIPVSTPHRHHQLVEKVSKHVLGWKPAEILRNSAIIAISNAGEEFGGENEDVLNTLINETSTAKDPTSDFLETIQEKAYDALWGTFLEEPIQDTATFPARFVVLEETSQGNYQQVEILPENSIQDQMNEVGFDWEAPTKIIIHGFLETGDETWIWDVGKALKAAENCNVIVVDWHEGSSLLYYDVVRNSRAIAYRIAKFLKELKKSNPSFSMRKVHLIGHSVGAHACGFVGQAVAPERVGRITGLDPAGFMFSIAPKELRLDSSDALLVDVIHTNAAPIYELGQGIPEPLGHVDIYVNGGQKQPGCSITSIPLETWIGVGQTDGFQGILDKLGCHHERAHDYYLESIKSTCPFTAYECESYEKFLAGKCLDCGANGRRCAPVGYHLHNFDTRASGNSSVIMFTTTNSQAPFCRYHYSIEVETSPDTKKSAAFGYLYAQVNGTKGEFPYKHLTKQGSKKFKPGQKYNFLMTSDKNIQEVDGIKLKWGNDDSYYSSVLCVVEESLTKCNNYLQVENLTFHGPPAQNQRTRNTRTRSYCWNKPHPQTLKTGSWRTFDMGTC